MKTKSKVNAGAIYNNHNARSIKVATVFCKIVVRSNVNDPWKIVITANASDPWRTAR